MQNLCTSILSPYQELDKQGFYQQSSHISYQDYILYQETGDRAQYEKKYFAQRRRLTGLALLLLYSREKKDYEKSLENVIWDICNEYTWALPAHLPSGGTQTDFEHDKLLDLFNCETALALLEIKRLFHNTLPIFLQQRIENEVNRRVLHVYLDQSRPSWKWESLPNNWNAVCSSSIGLISLYSIEDPDLLKKTLNRILTNLNIYLNSFMPDGISLEGYYYWSYGYYFFVAFAEELKKNPIFKLDLLSKEICLKIAKFQEYCFIGDQVTLSFSDSLPNEHYRIGLTYYLKNRYPQLSMPPKDMAFLEEDPYGRWLMAYRDFKWYKEYKDNINVASSNLKGNGLISQKQQWVIYPITKDNTGLGFAAKGGNNDEPHNHNDIGSFIINDNNRQLICDIGQGKYSKKYFGTGQYDIFCKSSLGHNVPIIEGKQQSSGPNIKSLWLEDDITESSISLKMDLSKAYELIPGKSITRYFNFDYNKSVLTLKDVYLNCHNYTERFITPFQPIQNEKVVTIPTSGGNLLLEVLSPELSNIQIHVHSEEHVSHNDSKEIYWVIDYEKKTAEKEDPFLIQFHWEK
ncbi:heparinase II/III family protein [Spirochaeta cellobiosiphila]|uniref:heparinase II/III family protein n=1 Tax=Spirochaeta cellobiosiphila TaxID=504483 RepID=UPI000406CD65|nr:heparinase II/III family protein [Spirochaeta cellobiosiphila]